MQHNAHKTGRAPVGPNVFCLCLHIKKGKDHFDTFNAHFIFAQFLIILHLSKRADVVQLSKLMHIQCLLSSIGKYVDWACPNALKHGTITVSGFGYFHKNCRFLWKKNANLGSTIHFTYSPYNKYFRLCMVSEELWLNEIGLFLQYRKLYICMT